jgi:hypothetical protein
MFYIEPQDDAEAWPMLVVGAILCLVAYLVSPLL